MHASNWSAMLVNVLMSIFVVFTINPEIFEIILFRE